MALLLEDVGQYAPASFHLPGIGDSEWRELCERYSNYRIEYTPEGDVLIMPGTDPITGARNADIGAELVFWAKQDRRGIACDSSTAFLLPSGARLSPDASWITLAQRDRIRAADQTIVTVPPFVIELKSASDNRRKFHEKMEDWIEAGVALGWAIDPELKRVTIYRASQAPEALDGLDAIDGEGPVAGFRLNLASIWA
jgi:Uma2 family endonuclease